MAMLPIDVLCLTMDTSPDDDPVFDWCQTNCRRTACHSVNDIATGVVDPADFDVVWWHSETIGHESLKAAGKQAAGALTAHTEAGGGLLLTGTALSVVDTVGIDTVAPDTFGLEFVDEIGGMSVKTLHFDHPIFEGLEGWIRTLPPGEYAGARYETLIPAHGQLLGSEIRGDSRLVGTNTVVSWSVGNGAVYGVGAGISFHDHVEGEFAVRRDQLLCNLLTTLASRRRPQFTDRPTTQKSQQALRERLADDPHRPGYHLTAPAHWLNDPNGLIQYDGTYHLFYQYNPGGPFHGSIHWGHATSDDLLTWTDQPVALAPDPDGPDRDGCWSGCAVVDDDGTPTILYTGGRGRDQLPCLATAANEELTGWNRDPRNPIIETVPVDPPLLETDNWAAEFRDHCVWQADGVWYHLIGAGLEDGGGVVLLYRGESLDSWEYVGPLLSGEYNRPFTVWECPELLEFDGRQLLHVSNYETVRYVVGTADLEAPDFAVEHEGIIDHGCLYAPQSLETDNGRQLMWGWLKPDRTVDAQWDAGWSGCFSLPRELSLDAEGRLRQHPAGELRELRDRHVAVETTLADGDFTELSLSGNCYELSLTAECDPDATLELGVFESPARSERTTIRYDGTAVGVDRSESSHSHEIGTDEQRVDVPGETLDLQVFVDGSVLELFINGRECLTCRVYPTRRDADGVSLSAVGGDVVVELDGWELLPTFPAGHRRQ